MTRKRIYVSLEYLGIWLSYTHTHLTYIDGSILCWVIISVYLK